MKTILQLTLLFSILTINATIIHTDNVNETLEPEGTIEIDFNGGGAEFIIEDNAFFSPPIEPKIMFNQFARVFPVKLTVLTSNGERATKEIFISVRGKSIQASFEASPLVGNAPLEVSFNPQKSTGNIREYYWTFGDGKESYLTSPKHMYKIPGTYIAKLKITDGRSLISEVEKKITVTDPNEEVVD